ncbi:acetolactate synthase 3 catalytic subunit [Escherichia coli]|uniref:Acetolactate synthase 3 catalytic subunit n=1 Tax=Escherichia coli TaxID=562 RepID=A0A376VNQ3_ECOLX|nr:acetolactate synthase 3 catalytic subunit [Escherichia coli]
MEMLSGAEMVVRSLIDQGVKQVFGYPGGAVLDIYDALHTVGGIDHVLVRHEQAAVHMADGLARATGGSRRRAGNVGSRGGPMRLPALPPLIWIPFH